MLRVGACLAGTVIAVLAASTSPTADAPLARRVLTVGYTVADLDRTVAFFRDVLSFDVLGERESSGRPFELLEGVFGAHVRIATLGLGSERLELTQYFAPEGRPFPPDARSNDRDFQHVAIIVSDMDQAYARLRSSRVRHASSGPQTLPSTIPAAAGIRAFYFRDPDGHFLEILQFPPDKGPARWHARDRLFLGVDHTAIVVSDTDASLRVYRDALGLTVAGTSENFGTEQEHLNNVFGAHLRITTLRATDGPGIELLEYLAPTTGRPAPSDLRANDLQHWETTIDVTDVANAASDLVRAGARRVSPGPVTLDGESSPFSEGALVRDADGHAIRVVRGATRGRATN
jgi:catechol 2,3-dioxygenase-like lactoylglutathione lyase family enzyme